MTLSIAARSRTSRSNPSTSPPGQIPVGPAGLKGDKGDKGSKGDSAATTVVVRRRATTTTGGAGGLTESVNCLPGERAIAGGIGPSDPVSGIYVTLFDSKPYPNTEGATPVGWHAGFLYARGGIEIVTYVICAKP